LRESAYHLVQLGHIDFSVVEEEECRTIQRKQHDLFLLKEADKEVRLEERLAFKKEIYLSSQ
jgi:hypothetical protein